MPKILYVGQDSTIATQLESHSQSGKLSSTHDLREALYMALESRFDIYVIDRDLRSVAAVGLCRLIREFDHGAKIISMSPNEADAALVREGYADIFLHKPSDADHVAETVSSIAAGAIKKHRSNSIG